MWPPSEARPYFLLEGHHQAQLSEDDEKLFPMKYTSRSKVIFGILEDHVSLL